MANKKRVLIFGGDGYLGWPTAMYFSNLGYEVGIADSLIKRYWEEQVSAKPLIPISTLERRVKKWQEVSGKKIFFAVGDITRFSFVYRIMERFLPDIIIHYAEQPSAPFSMESRINAVDTQVNNITGTLNILFAIKKFVPSCHLIKLGTMGEYGTPNIDIEEGWIDIEHNGRKDRMLYPKKPGSFYHLSKVHDSHNIHFACDIWGIKATDLNQGVVYGMNTDETKMHPEFNTSFHYDAVFGTALNRFCVQAVAGMPLTVYGKGGQKRGFLNILDTLQCVRIAAENPPQKGEFRVLNQFTEVFSINDLAGIVKNAGKELGLKVKVANIENPRIEKEEHYYNPKNDSFIKLGLKPNKLSDVIVNDVLQKVIKAKKEINMLVVNPSIKWRQ